MKNSDMKVIAIILSIALLFTIITSNAVSVVSVITLLKDGGTVAAEGTQTESGDAATNSGATNSGATNSGATNSGATNSGATDSGAADKGDANADAPATDNGGAAADNAILADPFAAYSKAANDIHTKGIAGYKKIGWQAVEGDLQLSKFSFLAGTLTSLISGFMTEKDAAEVNDCPKGSDDAKNRMPASNCSKSYVKSATAVQEGENYVVTIVLNDFTNPSYDDPDGLQLMSREFLDIKDVIETVATDETVSKIVSKVDGTIVYKDYTITATMNAKGEFIKIVHFGRGDINADVTAVGVGDLQASGALSFNAEYYDFVY